MQPCGIVPAGCEKGGPENFLFNKLEKKKKDPGFSRGGGGSEIEVKWGVYRAGTCFIRCGAVTHERELKVGFRVVRNGLVIDVKGK